MLRRYVALLCFAVAVAVALTLHTRIAFATTNNDGSLQRSLEEHEWQWY